MELDEVEFWEEVELEPEADRLGYPTEEYRRICDWVSICDFNCAKCFVAYIDESGRTHTREEVVKIFEAIGIKHN
jgi:hypothetical protein